GRDKFSGVGWEATLTGSPRLAGALAWVDCRVDTVHEAGDHWLVVGSVVDLGSAAGEPLIFYRGGFGGFRA
ncbi:MAG TPA: flavin reductase family protein, partial [Acidimicrobiales bacterium]|nr:flavin reductase family protein [Acidimicrobiales bacterium]